MEERKGQWDVSLVPLGSQASRKERFCSLLKELDFNF